MLDAQLSWIITFSIEDFDKSVHCSVYIVIFIRTKLRNASHVESGERLEYIFAIRFSYISPVGKQTSAEHNIKKIRYSNTINEFCLHAITELFTSYRRSTMVV